MADVDQLSRFVGLDQEHRESIRWMALLQLAEQVAAAAHSPRHAFLRSSAQYAREEYIEKVF